MSFWADYCPAAAAAYKIQRDKGKKKKSGDTRHDDGDASKPRKVNISSRQRKMTQGNACSS